MDTLYTFWVNMTHYKTESAHFLGLRNSATKIMKAPILLTFETSFLKIQIRNGQSHSSGMRRQLTTAGAGGEFRLHSASVAPR